MNPEPTMPLLVDTARFVDVALSLEGRPYVYDTKGPDTFDCSGLITYALWKAGGPDWRHTHACQQLSKALAEVEELAPGEVGLALYGRDLGHVSHAMIVLADGRTFGACGGDSGTLSAALAALKPEGGARVRYRSCVRYRRNPDDFLGFRRLSYPLLKVVPKEKPNV